MDLTPIVPATPSGGDVLVSFGSGNEGGRLNARARGTARNANASSAEVRAVRSSINRSSLSARTKSRLLREITDNSKGNGTIRRGILADIRSDLADLL